MILVTGGLGMIGAHAARALAGLGHEVVVTAHRRIEVASFLAGRVAVEPLDVTGRDAFLALAGRHDISDIVHLAGSLPDEDPVCFVRTEMTGLLNALDAARTRGVRRFAVASSIGVYAGRTETRWHEELALPAAELPHLIVAFKKAVEPLTTHSLRGSGIQPVVLRIGTIWGPLVDPESPFFPIPSYISAVLRGQEPRPLHADDGGDRCYAPDAGRAIALLMTAQLQASTSLLSALQLLVRRMINVAYLDPAEWGDHESLDPEKRKHKSPLSAAVVAAFDEATVGWNNALYAALLIAPPSVAAKIPELDREVDRLMDLAVGRTWTKTEFRQQRVDLGRLAADYLRLARSLAGLPDIELPSIWTWDSSNGTAPGHQDAESGSF